MSIVLDVDDNPYLVFESLNAKGRPLSQADLIRNYFFMRIHVDKQDEIYQSIWLPMQNALNDNLTEFIRHFLMKDGSIIKQSDVYYSLKEQVSEINAYDYLQTLYKYSEHYEKLLSPTKENDKGIRDSLTRLLRLEVTTAYPLLLNLYSDHTSGNLSGTNFVDILKVIENFLIRRFIEGIPTNQLNKIFPAVYSQLESKYPNDKVDGIKKILQNKGYPKDASFKASLIAAKVYGAGDRADKAKLILESIENHYGHKEAVPFEKLTVEHIMPQTLSEWWQNHLGDGWDGVHELLLHNIGNLTLTAYNAELSNYDFSSKKEYYKDSHLELNKYFDSISSWKKEEIETRTESLASIALKIWPYFGDQKDEDDLTTDVTGKTPVGFSLLGQYFEVNSWRDVLEETLNAISELESDKFETIIKQFPALIGKDKNKFRAVRELRSGYFVEVNLSAKNIQQFCHQLIEAIGLSLDDFKVEFGQPTDPTKKITKKDAPKFVPVNFNDKCIDLVKSNLDVNIDKIKSSSYESNDKKIGFICSVSKLYTKGGQRYWFAFHPRQKEFLEKYKVGYVVFGCGSPDAVLLIPAETFIPFLKNMNITEREDITYWHVHIREDMGKFYIAQPNFTNAVDITKYFIS